MKNLILIVFLLSQTAMAQPLTEQQLREMTEKMQTQMQQQNLQQAPTPMGKAQLPPEPAKPVNESQPDMTMAMAACKNKMRGMPCSINAGGGNRTPGVCYTESKKLPLFCRPSNHPAPRVIILKEKETPSKPAPSTPSVSTSGK